MIIGVRVLMKKTEEPSFSKKIVGIVADVFDLKSALPGNNGAVF